ncbi:MAG: hypothetical protein NTY69_06505 [Methylococcales bacterium]|nr:hypothetical protein [Methylococcales bacterium]
MKKEIHKVIGILKILSTLLIVTLLTGCMEKELVGEVFIVTNSGQSVKLGLVDVIAISENNIRNCIKEKKPQWIEKNNVITKEYLTNKEYYENHKSLIHTLQVIIEMHMELLAAGHIDTAEQAKNNENDVKYLHELEVQFEELSEKFNKIKMVYDNYQKGDFLLECITNNTLAKSTTNADGKFAIKVPNEKVAMYAFSKRKVFDETEVYYWLNWVDKDENNIIISNNNTYETSCPSCIVKLSELTN